MRETWTGHFVTSWGVKSLTVLCCGSDKKFYWTGVCKSDQGKTIVVMDKLWQEKAVDGISLGWLTVGGMSSNFSTWKRDTQGHKDQAGRQARANDDQSIVVESQLSSPTIWRDYSWALQGLSQPCRWPETRQKGAWEMGEVLVRVVNPLCRGVVGWLKVWVDGCGTINQTKEW
jgi:hypothetical protein